jgi:hypothetical protein
VNALAVREAMAKRGELTSWNKGLTKETDDRVAASALKIAAGIDSKDISRRLATRSESEKLRHYANISKANQGHRSWNTGITKEDNDGLRSAAVKISKIKQEFDPRSLTPKQFEERVNKSEKFELISEPRDYRNKYQKLLFKCKMCDLVQGKNLNSPNFCPKCSPKESKGQLEIYEYVKSLFPEALLSDKTVPGVSEIDVHVPSKYFGVEYNGLYWHSETAGKGPMYHQNKTDACAKQNISLLHVYADDWAKHPEIVRSMIRHRLGVSNTRTYARVCSVRSVDPATRRVFFERCHLDGDVSAKVAFGLYLEEKLIAVLSLRKAFHKKWHTHAEIARFAVELDSVVVGGLSKLVSAAVVWAKGNGYAAIMSYADGRVGVGAGYLAAGFKQHSITPPTFWWTDYEQRFNRFTYRADKSRNMSEREVADKAGVVRIYGCRNVVLTRQF